MMQPEDKTQEIAERAERLQEIGSSILRAARDELYLGMRFLDVALSSFSYQMDGQVHGFGTDGRVMYFQPQMLKIRDEGIPDGRDLQLPYSDITRFLQDDIYFFLYVKSTNSTYILKRNAFQPNNDVQVMACLQEKLAHCKGIR